MFFFLSFFSSFPPPFFMIIMVYTPEEARPSDCDCYYAGKFLEPGRFSTNPLSLLYHRCSPLVFHEKRSSPSSHTHIFIFTRTGSFSPLLRMESRAARETKIRARLFSPLFFELVCPRPRPPPLTKSFLFSLYVLGRCLLPAPARRLVFPRLCVLPLLSAQNVNIIVLNLC